MTMTNGMPMSPETVHGTSARPPERLGQHPDRERRGDGREAHGEVRPQEGAIVGRTGPPSGGSSARGRTLSAAALGTSVSAMIRPQGRQRGLHRPDHEGTDGEPAEHGEIGHEPQRGPPSARARTGAGRRARSP